MNVGGSWRYRDVEILEVKGHITHIRYHHTGNIYFTEWVNTSEISFL